MAAYMKNGYPVGSVAEIVHYKLVELVKRECLVQEYSWHERFQTEMYTVMVDGKHYVVYPHQLSLVKMPQKWENWAANKVTMLLKITPSVAFELQQERRRGE